MRTVASKFLRQKLPSSNYGGASEHFNYMDGIGLIAVLLLATTLTREPFLVSGPIFALSLSWLLFTLISGALVDRFDHRPAFKTTNFGRFLILGGLGFYQMSGLICPC
jgi:predicted membrane channel-forming protein YqfA (hemolysin III family)